MAKPDAQVGSVSSLEGVRLKQTVCGSCGYHVGGTPVTNGVVRCPECGHDTIVSPELHERLIRSAQADAPHRAIRGWIRAIGLSLIVFGVGLFWVVGWPSVFVLGLGAAVVAAAVFRP